jgi:hypothetical protein
VKSSAISGSPGGAPIYATSSSTVRTWSLIGSG